MRITPAIVLPLLWLGAGFPTAQAAALAGPASGYNAFLFGDFTSANSDTEGNLAAGGAVNVSNYSVASHINGNPSASPNPARLVAGNLTASNGGVGNGQNGAIYAAHASLSSFTATGGVFSQTLVDFAAARTQYQTLSTYWDSLTANGSAANNYGSLTLTGSNTVLNVFDLDGGAITNTNSVDIYAPAGSTVLINVGGTGQTFQNGQVTLHGIDPTHVIYNFFDSRSLNLAGSKNPNGSILAPWASVSGGYGQMYGQLLAESFNGNIEFHNFLFAGSLPDPVAVPEPATFWLFGPALLWSLGKTARRGTPARPPRA